MSDSVTVYTYTIMNADNHRNVACERMATAEAIRRVNGHMDLASATEVAPSEVTEEGFCVHPITPVSIEAGVKGSDQ